MKDKTIEKVAWATMALGAVLVMSFFALIFWAVIEIIIWLTSK